MNVDFPAPEGPIIATKLPRSMVVDTPRKALPLRQLSSPDFAPISVLGASAPPIGVFVCVCDSHFAAQTCLFEPLSHNSNAGPESRISGTGRACTG